MTISFSESMNFDELKTGSEDTAVVSRLLRADTLSSDDLDISIAASNENEQSKLGFTWFLESKTTTSLTLQLVFENPDYVSSQVSGDTLSIQF